MRFLGPDPLGARLASIPSGGATGQFVATSSRMLKTLKQPVHSSRAPLDLFQLACKDGIDMNILTL